MISNASLLHCLNEPALNMVLSGLLAPTPLQYFWNLLCQRGTNSIEPDAQRAYLPQVFLIWPQLVAPVCEINDTGLTNTLALHTVAIGRDHTLSSLVP